MNERFVQKRVSLIEELSTGKLKVSKLISLLDQHPYAKAVAEEFRTDDMMEEFITIDHIDIVFNKIRFINEHFKRSSIHAFSKDVTIEQSEKEVDDINAEKPLIFSFKEYVELGEGEVKTDLDCYAIYDSKNTFFDEYDMAKFANRLYKDNLAILARYNTDFFKDLAEKNPRFNKKRSYRLVKSKDQTFLRGITSTDRYYEYGVDFAFVIAILILHRNMKKNAGTNYMISSAALSESKLELIVAEKHLKDAGEFGKVSSAMIISTNDLGTSSLNFTKIIKVGVKDANGVYLFPTSEQSKQNKLIISHSTSPQKAIPNFSKVDDLLDNTDEYITDLQDIKGITNPEELRLRIVNKLENPRSAFKDIHDLKDIFKTVISSEISSFAKLLTMCNKAEELDIDYDLKDKLRYIISDIILSGRK